MTFKIGDIVRLKSGGPAMTVIEEQSSLASAMAGARAVHVRCGADMTANQICVLVFAYVTLGSLMTIMASVTTDPSVGSVDIPDDVRPAIMCTVFLLWPLAVTVSALYGIWYAATTIARGYAALWRQLRGPGIPRATAGRR